MADYPLFSRMPGAIDATEADFDPGEVSGMRFAGFIFLTTALSNVLAWLVTGNGPSLAILIQTFLGIQMLRFRHSWRAWAMLGAGLGAAAVVLMGALLLATSWQPAGVAGAGALALLNGAILLLLVGRPSLRRVAAGRVAFGIGVVLAIASLVRPRPAA